MANNYKITLSALRELCENTYFNFKKGEYGYSIYFPNGELFCTVNTIAEAFAYIMGFNRGYNYKKNYETNTALNL